MFPTLTDLWNGLAEFVLDTSNIAMGSPFNMNNPSFLNGPGIIYAYLIQGKPYNGVIRLACGRAHSTDATTWVDDGHVLEIGGEWQWVFPASSFAHNVGRASANGWCAIAGTDKAGYMCFGPYTTTIPGGPNNASFRLMIDNITAPDDHVVTLEVNDATTTKVIASNLVTRHQFPSANNFTIHHLNFESQPGHSLEFRVWWHGVAFIDFELVAIAQGHFPFWDETMASFPSVFPDGGTTYLVYEGFGPPHPGAIGLAASGDGLHFLRSPINPILENESTGWESVNIGTPSLYKSGSTWYLFYHGFDGKACRIGVATGTDLTSLRKNGPPIIDVGIPGQWDSGTAGRRSQIILEDGYYYMAFEGSTDPPYDFAVWSSGIARSRDLIHWEKFRANPVIPRFPGYVDATSGVQGGMGNDGSELLKYNGETFLYVIRIATNRYRLQWAVPRT
jgi:hypothetical protein